MVDPTDYIEVKKCTSLEPKLVNHDTMKYRTGTPVSKVPLGDIIQDISEDKLLEEVEDDAGCVKLVYETRVEYRHKISCQLHRLNGPAFLHVDGTRIYFIEGAISRTDGPAILKPDGSLEWYLDDNLHRVDGPARVFPSTPKLTYYDFENISNFTEQWWIEGTQITNQEDIALVKDILGKRKWATIYLYRNHPVFKYFCRVAVKKSWIRFLSLDFYKKLGK